MNRKTAREHAFLALFELSFSYLDLQEICEGLTESGEYELDDFSRTLLRAYEEHASEIEGMIVERLKGWQASRVPRVSMSVLRLALAEMLYGPQPDMDSVVINEAVELAKRYGDEKDYQFVNGVLGAVSRARAGQPAAAGPVPAEDMPVPREAAAEEKPAAAGPAESCADALTGAAEAGAAAIGGVAPQP